MQNLYEIVGIQIYKTANDRYTVEYKGEKFIFINWQDVVEWIGFIKEGEKHEQDKALV